MTDEILESFNGTRIAGSIAAEALDKVAEIIKANFQSTNPALW